MGGTRCCYSWFWLCPLTMNSGFIFCWPWKFVGDIRVLLRHLGLEAPAERKLSRGELYTMNCWCSTDNGLVLLSVFYIFPLEHFFFFESCPLDLIFTFVPPIIYYSILATSSVNYSLTSRLIYPSISVNAFEIRDRYESTPKVMTLWGCRATFSYALAGGLWSRFWDFFFTTGVWSDTGVCAEAGVYTLENFLSLSILQQNLNLFWFNLFQIFVVNITL